MEKGQYRVIKPLTDAFVVDIDGVCIVFRSRKRNKQLAIIAGDLVQIEDGVITDVAKRKNALIRPPIANVDTVIIVLAPTPAPDLLLVDKLLVNCINQGIEPIICLNKSDLKQEKRQEITDEYREFRVIESAAISGDVTQITAVLKGKLVCLAGQSAVGKSTITNAILGKSAQKVGELSAIARGRNTTTGAEIFSVCGGYLADTPGFSLLDLHDIKQGELDLYYPEFIPLLGSCKYHRCTHTDEPLCAVRAAAQEEKINRNRYARYLTLYGEHKTDTAWKTPSYKNKK